MTTQHYSTSNNSNINTNTGLSNNKLFSETNTFGNTNTNNAFVTDCLNPTSSNKYGDTENEEFIKPYTNFSKYTNNKSNTNPNINYLDIGNSKSIQNVNNLGNNNASSVLSKKYGGAITKINMPIQNNSNNNNTNTMNSIYNSSNNSNTNSKINIFGNTNNTNNQVDNNFGYGTTNNFERDLYSKNTKSNLINNEEDERPRGNVPVKKPLTSYLNYN